MRQAVTIIATLFLIGFTAAPALADNFGLDATAKRAGLVKTVAGRDSIEGVAGKVVQVALSFLGIIFFGLALYAGINWMTARGNEEDITKSKDTLEAAITGLIIVLAAYAVATFVFSQLADNPSPETGTACAVNGQKDGEETDVDCGFDCKAKCQTEKKCIFEGDCESGVCVKNICG